MEYINKNNSKIDIKFMEEIIHNEGNNKVWKIIESWSDPIIRLYYRKLFFLAGGEHD